MDDEEKPKLKRVSSPEELDTRLVVIGSKGWVALTLTSILVLIAILWAIFGVIPNTYETEVMYLSEKGFDLVHSQVEGVVDTVFIQIGDSVDKGQELLTVKQGNKKWKAVAQAKGKIIDLYTDMGSPVDAGDPLILLEEDGGEYSFFAFIPIDRAQQIKEGMPVYIQPSGIRVQEYGSIEATVAKISPFIASKADLTRLLGNTSLIPYFTNNAPTVIVKVTPNLNPNTESGFEWTSGFGPPTTIQPQTVGKGLFVLEARRPISYVIPIWQLKKTAYDVQEGS